MSNSHSDCLINLKFFLRNKISLLLTKHLFCLCIYYITLHLNVNSRFTMWEFSRTVKHLFFNYRLNTQKHKGFFVRFVHSFPSPRSKSFRSLSIIHVPMKRICLLSRTLIISWRQL